MVWKRFFQVYSKESNKSAVVETSMVSFFDHYCILFIALLSRSLSEWSGVDAQYIIIRFDSGIDALVIIPFSKLRAYQYGVCQ
jgi:hypothetical protein